MLYLKQNKFKSNVYRDMNRVKLYIEASKAEKVAEVIQNINDEG